MSIVEEININDLIEKKIIYRFSFIQYFCFDILPFLIGFPLIFFPSQTIYFARDIVGSAYFVVPYIMWLAIIRYWTTPYPSGSIIYTYITRRYGGKALWVENNTLYFFDKETPIDSVAKIEKESSFWFGDFKIKLKDGTVDSHPVMFVHKTIGTSDAVALKAENHYHGMSEY
jgi:hypothetical protein